MAKQKQKTYIQAGSSTAVNTAEKYFTADLFGSLQTLIESIEPSQDGVLVKVQSIRIALRLYSTAHFIVQPIICQTAGTVSDISNVDYPIVNTLLNAAIDDVFGFELIGPTKVSRIQPFIAAGQPYHLEITFDVPRQVTTLLNKETETERLQDLYAMVIGMTEGATQTVTLKRFVTVSYTEDRKSITFR